MNIGIYQSAASLSALEQWQDAVSQNITSSQMTGFRQRVVSVSGSEGGAWQVATGDSSTPTTVNSVFPAASTSISYQTGENEHTGRTLDVAIQGDGFFAVQQRDGTRAYTRNGEFSMTADHRLVTSSGATVLNQGGGAITLLPDGDITINSDGTIVQGQTAVGRLGVFAFKDNQQLTPAGAGLFTSQSGQPTPVAKPEVLQGYREASNVSPMREMVNLVQISRAYEANQKVITNDDKEGQKAVEELG